MGQLVRLPAPDYKRSARLHNVCGVLRFPLGRYQDGVTKVDNVVLFNDPYAKVKMKEGD